MKKFFLLIAAFAALSAAAQNPEALQKKIEKNNAAIADAKKSTSPSTWLERANIFLDMANVYTNKIVQGIAMEQANSIIGKPTSSEVVVISDVQYNKHEYDNFIVYASADQDLIQFWSSKKGNEYSALNSALESLTKMKELNAKDFKTKGTPVSERLKSQYSQIGMTSYNLGEKAKAAQFFEGSVKTSELMGQVDTMLVYYSGVALCEAGQFDKALPIFDKLLAYGDDQNGMAYLYMSMCYENMKQIDKAAAILETGFEKVPTNVSLISALINIYLNNNLDSKKLVEMVKKAQTLDPKNASLYMVEGTVWNKMGDVEKAEEALRKAIAMDANSYEAHYNLGLIFAIAGDAVRENANKLDLNDTKGYDAAVAEMEKYYDKAIDVLEKTHELKKDDMTTVELLRQLYYIKRDKDAKFMERYKYFNDLAPSKE